MKKIFSITLIITLLLTGFLLAGCNSDEKAINNKKDGGKVEISLEDLNLEGLTDKQITLVENAVEDGNTRSLLKTGLFTVEDMERIGLVMKNKNKGDYEKKQITIEDLNLEGLTDEQITLIEESIENKDINSLLKTGVFTVEDMKRIGLIMDDKSKGDYVEKQITIEDLNLAGLSDEQIAFLEKAIENGDFRSIKDGELFSEEELKSIFGSKK